MSIALMPVFDVDVVDLIYDFMPTEPDEPDIWETCYGTTYICNVKHIVLYGGGPEGGLVFFNKKRRKGWYKWHRDWFQYAKYEKITEGQVATKHASGEDEKFAILPSNWEELGYGDDEDIMILDDDRMFELTTDW